MTNGTPARSTRSATGLGMVGLIGVTRCTRSNSPDAIRLPNFCHTSCSKYG
jgi:hypothetical protein